MQYIIAIRAKGCYFWRMERMITIRADAELIKMFDKVAKKHNRDRTKELKSLMVEDIKKEFPDFSLPESTE